MLNPRGVESDVALDSAPTEPQSLEQNNGAIEPRRAKNQSASDQPDDSAMALSWGLKDLEKRIKAQIFAQLNAVRKKPNLLVTQFKQLKNSKDARLKTHQANAISRGIERGKKQSVAPTDRDAADRKDNAHTLDQWIRANQGARQEHRKRLLTNVADAEIGKAIRQFSKQAPLNTLNFDDNSYVSAALEEHVHWIVESNRGKISYTRPNKAMATPSDRAGREVAENLSMFKERVSALDLKDPLKLNKLAAHIATQCVCNHTLDLCEFLTGAKHRRNLYEVPASHLALAVRAVPEGSFTRFVVGLNLYE